MISFVMQVTDNDIFRTQFHDTLPLVLDVSTIFVLEIMSTYL